MHKTLFILMAGAAMVASGGAQAQNIAKIGQKSDWALYSYNDDKGKVCYTLTTARACISSCRRSPART
jgi:hypothetical protein